MKQLAIGIDLGGTNLKGIVMEPGGRHRHLTRVPTEAEKGGKRVLENLLALIGVLIEKEGGSEAIRGVGIGTPGFVDRRGVMVGGAANLPGWVGTRLFEPIRERYGLRAAAANDVTVAALGEARFGAGRDVRNMVLMALGTGIGGGVVIDGRVYNGTHGMAAELGHITVDVNGLQCNCGARGCVEQYASAPGIVRVARLEAESYAGTTHSELLTLVRDNAHGFDSKTVYDHVARGDPFALHVNEVVCGKLGVAVGIVLNCFAPDRLILGGGVMKAGRVIIDTVSRYTPRYCWPEIRRRCEIHCAQLGEDAGVLGCGALVFDALTEEGDERSREADR